MQGAVDQPVRTNVYVVRDSDGNPLIAHRNQDRAIEFAKRYVRGGDAVGDFLSVENPHARCYATVYKSGEVQLPPPRQLGDWDHLGTRMQYRLTSRFLNEKNFHIAEIARLIREMKERPQDSAELKQLLAEHQQQYNEIFHWYWSLRYGKGN